MDNTFMLLLPPYISSLKTAKHRLSNLALEEIFGEDNIDALFGGNISQMNEYGTKAKDGSLPNAEQVRFLWYCLRVVTGCLLS